MQKKLSLIWGPYQAIIFVSRSGSFSRDTSGDIPAGKNSKTDFQVWPSESPVPLRVNHPKCFMYALCDTLCINDTK